MPRSCVLQIWANGDVSMADKIMAPDVDLYNVVYGGVKKGVDEFKSMVKGIFSVRARLAACHLLQPQCMRRRALS